MEWIIGLATFTAVFMGMLALANAVGLIAHPVDRRIYQYRPGAMGSADNGFSQQAQFQSALETIGHKIAPTNERDKNDVKQRLREAGYYSEQSFYVYWGTRVFLVLSLPFFAFIATAPYLKIIHPVLILLMAGGLGFILPDLHLRWKRSRRHEQIFRGLPDALDLLVVCLEAGLGLDAAMQKVSEEFSISNAELSKEMKLTCAAIRLGQERNEALHDLGNRTGVTDVKALVAVLIQADKFGTSTADALRVHADDMRTRRKQIAEEKAAKTTVKLIFPLVLFIFPSIFVVLGGPAAIQIMEKFMNH